MAMVGAFAFVLFLFGIWLVILPAVKKAARLNLETSQIGTKQELLKQIQDARTRAEELEVGLPQEKERHLILSHITTLAKRSGLDVDVVSPDTSVEAIKGIYPAFSVRVSAVGSFQKSVNFLGGFEKNKPKLAITSIEFDQRGGDEKTNSISISVIAQTLLLKSQETQNSLRGA